VTIVLFGVANFAKQKLSTGGHARDCCDEHTIFRRDLHRGLPAARPSGLPISFKAGENVNYEIASQRKQCNPRRSRLGGILEGMITKAPANAKGT